MAHIVNFRCNVARAEPDRGTNGEPQGQSGAQIIIFPGVRRERHTEPPAKSRRCEKGRPKRDRLELPD